MSEWTRTFRAQHVFQLVQFCVRFSSISIKHGVSFHAKFQCVKMSTFSQWFQLKHMYLLNGMHTHSVWHIRLLSCKWWEKRKFYKYALEIIWMASIELHSSGLCGAFPFSYLFWCVCVCVCADFFHSVCKNSYRKAYSCNNFDMKWYLKCKRKSEKQKGCVWACMCVCAKLWQQYNKQHQQQQQQPGSGCYKASSGINVWLEAAL